MHSTSNRPSDHSDWESTVCRIEGLAWAVEVSRLSSLIGLVLSSPEARCMVCEYIIVRSRYWSNHIQSPNWYVAFTLLITGTQWLRFPYAKRVTVFICAACCASTIRKRRVYQYPISTGNHYHLPWRQQMLASSFLPASSNCCICWCLISWQCESLPLMFSCSFSRGKLRLSSIATQCRRLLSWLPIFKSTN